MKLLERLGWGKNEADLDHDINRAQEDVSRIQGQVTVEKNKYPDEENNTELQRLKKQLQDAQDRLNLLLAKQRREGEKVEELSQ